MRSGEHHPRSAAPSSRARWPSCATSPARRSRSRPSDPSTGWTTLPGVHDPDVDGMRAKFDVDTAQLDGALRHLGQLRRPQPHQPAAHARGAVPPPLRRRAGPARGHRPRRRRNPMTTAETAGGATVAPVVRARRRRHDAEQGGRLTGTWTLVRFILRRDRVRLAVWIFGIVLLVLSTAASIERPLPHPGRPRHGRGRPRTTTPRSSPSTAPTYGLDTLGGQVVFNVGSFGYVVVALMGMFLVGPPHPGRRGERSHRAAARHRAGPQRPGHRGRSSSPPAPSPCWAC